jgi:hypothetical protein
MALPERRAILQGMFAWLYFDAQNHFESKFSQNACTYLKMTDRYTQ